MKIEEVVERKLGKDTTLKTYYKCVDDNKEETEVQVFKKFILKDKRYISVAPIINKSASKNLPKNIDTIVKNAINNISSNYVLIDADNVRNNEYRIEGAITGLIRHMKEVTLLVEIYMEVKEEENLILVEEIVMVL